MGGYLASREVLTAADRRQTMPAGDIRQMCVSPDLIPVMDTCVRPFLCCVSDVPSLCSPRPPARRSVAGGRSLSVTHPPLPCVLSLARYSHASRGFCLAESTREACLASSSLWDGRASFKGRVRASPSRLRLFTAGARAGDEYARLAAAAPGLQRHDLRPTTERRAVTPLAQPAAQRCARAREGPRRVPDLQ